MTRPTHPCRVDSSFVLFADAGLDRETSCEPKRHVAASFSVVFLTVTDYHCPSDWFVLIPGPLQIRFFLCTCISLNGVGSGVVQMGVAYDDF
ncbi:hypothetical protein BO78DRAFT_210034 [Aspergillus sclerotiicarbonarius CBS 121057]|uniref:Uncharacterized protein n=1 Tax=Aspergillus sclerotiicarbonarius (strain CBS 121057 / IBT 28362) TaxID=1448318 RepID=A0A319EGP1_ASPSB|nr:hypothetical protein BO78DRAFT_210034 [Aspergillus sclerotiicarbonarius CBS 121057]